MNGDLERVYGEALDLLEQGESIQAILARYPAYQSDLRPFLRTATELSGLAAQPSLAAEKKSKKAFLAAAGSPGPSRAASGWLGRLFAPALAGLVVVFFGMAALAGASSSAVPGSALYEVKRTVEETRLALATDPEQAAALRERFRRERADEIERLLAAGIEADVTLSGTIDELGAETSGAERWIVAGFPVIVTAETVIDGTPATGALVEIDGRTANGMVRASRVAVISGLLPTITPMAEDAPGVVPQPTNPATATPATGVQPAHTPTATGTTASATPTATITAGPSTPAPVTPQPPPTTDPEDDNGNDNGGESGDPSPAPTAAPDDDNGNDNGGGDDNGNDNGGDDNNGDDNGGDDDNGNDNGGDDDNDNGSEDGNDNGD